MRTRSVLTAAAVAALLVPGVASAAPAGSSAGAFPSTIELPATFAPEGIAIGGGPTAYAGSLADGDIVRVDLRSGTVDLLVDRDDAIAVGLALDPSGRTLYAAGGPSGLLSIVDTRTGDLTDVVLPGAAFANDVIVTRDAVWVTDSFAPTVFRVARDGSGVTALTVTGDYTFVPGGFNFNGIEASTDGDTVYVISSTAGELLALDVSDVDGSSATVAASVVDTAAELTAGDGILLQGRDLTVVRNRLNQLTTLRLSPDGTSATLVDTTTQDDFAVPTTVAALGRQLYVVNARFGQPAPLESEIVAVR